MRRQETIEFSAIALGGMATLFFAPLLPRELGIGAVSLICASLLLVQSLIRDLVLLYTTRRQSRPAGTRTASCMCVESMLGFTGVVVGGLLLFIGNTSTVELHRLGWITLVLATMLLGFIIKDWVVTWRPWGVSRERDHLNLIVRWRG